jgi:hypothetical protein
LHKFQGVNARAKSWHRLQLKSQPQFCSSSQLQI